MCYLSTRTLRVSLGEEFGVDRDLWFWGVESKSKFVWGVGHFESFGCTGSFRGSGLEGSNGVRPEFRN